jgi:Helix-turn-helix domain of resolvase
MIRAGFLDPESRSDLIELTRDGSVAHRLARRATAGTSVSALAKRYGTSRQTVMRARDAPIR